MKRFSAFAFFFAVALSISAPVAAQLVQLGGPYSANISYGLAAGDLDADGYVDIIETSTFAANIWYRNDQSGGFSVGQSFGLPASEDAAAAVANFDKSLDGSLDVVTVSRMAIASSARTNVYLNTGTALNTTAAWTGLYDQWSDDVAVGDFNNDGWPDFVVANRMGDSRIWINDQAGSGVSFSELVVSGANVGAAGVTVARLNADSYDDIVFSDGTVVLSNGSGVFSASNIGSSGFRVDSADLNGDTHQDLVFTGNYAPMVVRLGVGDGTFGTATSFGETGDPRFDASLADVNNDGNVDILIAGWAAVNAPFEFVYEGDGLGGFSVSSESIAGERAILGADVDGDGDADVVTSHPAAVFQNQYAPGRVQVVSTNDSGPGSLRAAIEYANATSGFNTIEFDIPGQPDDVHTIQLLTALPVISDAATLDATTQGDATCGSPGFNDRLLRVVLDGSLMSVPSDVGLHLNDGNSTVQGFVIQNMPQHAINVTSNGNTIRCNYIGTDADGLTAAGNGRLATGAGVFLQAPSNTVTANVVAANTYDEIRTESGGFNQITDNYVGVSRNLDLLPSLSTTINPGNRERIGITTGSNDGVSGNVIGGFFQGIAFGSSNIIRENRVGIGPSGQSIPNTYGLFSFGSSTAVGRDNVISNNGTGVYIQSIHSSNSIQGNSFFGNGAKAIDLASGANGGIVAPTLEGARIDDNGILSVAFSAPASGTVTFSKADSEASGEGQTELPSSFSYTAPGTMSIVLGNAASFSLTRGDFLVMTITDASNNTSEFSAPLEIVDPLLVTNASDSGQGSLRQAVLFANSNLNGASQDDIVFAIPGAGPHTVSLLSEIEVSEPINLNGITQPNATCGNNPGDRDLRIVLESSGTSVMRLMPAASGSTIRGLVFGTSAGYGLILDGAGSTTVECNYFGTEADGTTLAEISDIALQISAATNNVIGGASATEGNLISGAVDAQVVISGGSGTRLQHNIVGLNKFGSAVVLPSGGGAIGLSVVQSPNTVVVSNQMGGFVDAAISIENSSAPDINNNFIGTNANWSGTFANGVGVRLLNGTSDGQLLQNYITGSTSDAIEVVGNTSLRNQIVNNRIYQNAGLPIDLVGTSDSGDGRTANDAGDADTGPNTLLNYPEAVTAQINGSGDLVLSWTAGTPIGGGTVYTVEFYAESSTDRFEAARVYAVTNTGVTQTVTAGPATGLGVSIGDRLVVNHVEFPTGNTSEFSPAITVTGPLTVSNTNDSGPGSLRQAILSANAAGGTPTITFDLTGTTGMTGSGVYTIAPQSGLPAITTPLVIDGLSQTNATCGTTDFSDRALKIVLDGSNIAYVPGGPLGLDIAEGTNNVTIQGLVIHSFPGGGVRIGMDNTGNVIRCNYVGTDDTGSVAQGNFGSGVQIDGFFAPSTGNTIGGPDRIDGNLISANSGDEIHFEPGADGNTIRNNFIGTNAAGTAKLPAPAGYFNDPDLDNFSNNAGIGNNQGAGNTIRDNVVGGFNIGIGLVSQNDGNRDWGGGNMVYGNHVGVALGGAVDLGNFSGISLDGSVGGEVVGGSGAGDGNVFRFNFFGVRMGGAIGSQIRYNDITYNNTGILLELAGLNASVTNNFIRLNSQDGIRVSNADGAQILENTIGANGRDGIYLLNVANFLTIADNTIGLAEDGETPLGNTRNGISILNSRENQVYRNVIAANGDAGIDIRQNSDENILWGNTVGLTRSGALVAGDSNLNGIIVASSASNAIGVEGNDPNIISGNREAGLIIEEPGSTLNSVVGNLIGVDISGNAARPNGTDGIRIWFGAHDNTVGGSNAARNVISGNGHHGISIADANIDTPSLVNEAIVISHNHIGVSFDGSSAMGNGWAGIYAGYGSKDLVISNNVTSGNGGSGIALDNGVSGSTISANISGLNALGNAPIPNGDDGIAVTNGSFNNQVSGNTSSGNLKSGINLFNVGEGNTAVLNVVGTDAGGTGQFGNGWHGFQIGAGGTVQVGGAGVGNTIAFNTDAGVIVYAPDGWDVSNAFISENIMYGNGGLGIDLKLDSGTDGTLGTLNQQGGRNGNDPSDTDDGPNGLINAPVFNWATRQASNVEMEVFFDGPLPATIEVFEADADNDEGLTLLGTSVVSTKRTFLSFPSGSVNAGDYLVATATGAEGTSEFALAFEVALGEDATLVRDQILTDTDVLTFKLASDLNAIPGMAAAMQAAIQSWNNVSTSDVASRIAYGGPTTTTAPVLTDYENVITKSSALIPLSSNTLAVASKLLLAPATPGGEATILTADIVFNAELIGQATGIGTDLVKGIWDAQAVATHEFGHTLGMRHSGVSTATMFFSIPSGTSYRSLEADDKAWISQRYPSGTAASTFGSISGTVTDGESGLSNALSGALVVARHKTSGARVHAYADVDGSYLIPGLLPGTYEVSIQPLDGLVDNVPGMRPGTVSPYLRAITQNATFSEEFWSGAAETNDETEDLPVPVSVQAGATTAGIDFVSNDDTTAPVVNGATPKGTRVPVRPEIAVTFSEPVTTANIAFQLWNVTTGLQVPGTAQVPGGASVVATFDIAPGTNLVYDNVYEIRVQNPTDKKGNTNTALFTAQFTVRPADIVPPTVTSVTPGNNAADVNSGTEIVITFSEPMDQAALAAGITLACTTAPLNTQCPATESGTLTFPTSSVIEGLPGWVAVFKPSARLIEGATYTVSLAANLTDLSGNALGSVSPTTFTTQPNVNPVVAGFAPADGATGLSIRTSVFADFNEPVVLVPGNVTMTTGATNVAGVAELLNDGKRIVFRPTVPLAYATSYTVTFSGSIQDASIPPMPLGTPLSIGFTTANAPLSIELTSVSPPVAIPGAVVTFGGSGFSPNPLQNEILFPAIGGGTVQAYAESSTLNSLTVVVPDGVTSGPVSVSYGGTTDAITLELYDVLPSVDPAVSRTVAESAPRDVEISPDGGTAYVTNTGSGTVSVLDIGTGDILESIRVGDQPLKVVLSPDGSRIYVSNFGSHTVSIISTATMTVLETIDVGLNPFGLAISPDGKRLYVAEYTSRKISIIDVDGDSGTENRAIARISVESNERDGAVEPDGGVRLGADTNPRDIEVSPDGGTLFFTTQELGLRYLVLDANGSANEDAATVRITKETGTRDVEVSPDGGVVWVTTLAGGLIGYRVPDDLLLDGSFQAVARLGAESNSREVEVSPDGGLLYVTSFDLGLVQIYAISSQIIPSTNSASGMVFALTLEPIKTIIVGDQPEAVVFSPAAQVAIVTNSGSDDVTVLRFTDEPPVVSNPDTDGDGLLDVDEVLLGTDPTVADTDGDGLSDGDEVNTFGTDPLLADTDADGLSDGDEVNGGITSPLLADTDDDGLRDDVEVAPGSLTLANNPDTDDDGKLDGVDPDADGSGAPDVRQRMLADFDAFVAQVSGGNAGGNAGGPGKGNETHVVSAAKSVDDVFSKGGGKSGKSNKSGKSDKSEKDGPSVEDVIDDIREKLEANLDAKLYEESMRPDEKRGQSMFNNDKNVLKKLSDLNDLLEDSDEDIMALATSILRTDLDIVTDLLAELDATTCASNKKCRKELESAQESFADALEELEIESASDEDLALRSRKDDDKAIDDLRKAWQSAVKALGKAGISYGKGIDEALLAEVPVEFDLSQNYPNPFNPTTTINFALKEAVEVRLDVFDLLGRHIQTLVQQPLDAGNHQIQFDASRLASGMYLYRIQAGDFVQVKQMTLLK